jgi:uncharacterized protein (UPF0332 family)
MSADKEILKLMIEKAESKLAMANIAFINNQYDDSVSRSYYSVFHAISALLFTKDLSFSSHSQTIGAFNKEFIKTEIFPKYYSKKIQTLFDERHTGDYDIHSDIDVVTANDSIEFAKEFINTAKSYLDKSNS